MIDTTRELSKCVEAGERTLLEVIEGNRVSVRRRFIEGGVGAC